MTKLKVIALFCAVVALAALFIWKGKGLVSGGEEKLFGVTVSELQKARAILVNVLDETAFNDAHIAGGSGVYSINIPFDKMSDMDKLPKSATIVTYCSNYMCMACHSAAKHLIEAQYPQVRIYAGGMAEWYQYAQQNKDLYRFEGPARMSYLGVVVNRPENLNSSKEIITAEELQKLIAGV